ncbi:MAG: membrane protein insertase YidC [Hydrogenophilales bacterium]|nr:membrane protein insertase YidC [Hydrogenophilales bacterium]
MDTKRLILFVVFSMSIFMLWDAWQREQNPQPITPQPTAQTPANSGIPTPTQAAPAAPSSPSVTPAASPQLAKGERIKVKTDLFDAEIDVNGGDIRRMVLIKHGSADDKKKPIVLLSDEAPHFYVAQTGLIGAGLPTHKELFTAAAKEYAMSADAKTLEVRLAWQGANGVQVNKIYTFHRGSYLIDLAYEIKNSSGQAMKADAYFQLLRDDTPPAGDSKFLPTYTGPAIYTEAQKFQKHAFDDIGKDAKKDNVVSKDGWVAMLQHYFLAAYLPQGAGQREFYTKKLSDKLFAAGVIMPLGEIAPSADARIKVPLYVGPQEQETLKSLAPGLDLAIDYGWLTVVAVPIFWLLNLLHKWIGNWGWAIIVLTILIKGAFYPLSAASYRSMAKMKLLAPRLQKMKEQYGDDRQKMHQAMMEMYKTEKINPLGGCLPVVVQIPVFIALYWVLLYSVEMRHAPFALWIQDLTATDPYYVLPVIMGLSMIVQTKLNPTPPDPIQAKVMMIMPVAFSIFFFWFPAGLVLYWVVNNVLSIAQQWRINHVLGHAPKPVKR